MPDREKVIRIIDELIFEAQKAPTWKAENALRCLKKELLKEQEEVEPIKPIDKDDDYTFMCSNCKGELFCGDVLRDNFCPTCGMQVKWE